MILSLKHLERIVPGNEMNHLNYENTKSHFQSTHQLNKGVFCFFLLFVKRYSSLQ